MGCGSAAPKARSRGVGLAGVRFTHARLVTLLASAVACNDETVEVVTKDVCYSEQRWVGGKRGSPEMFPGRDCVSCHIENDGPQLAIGGTIYPYVIDRPEAFEVQSGTDCFGLEGVTVRIEDADGQLFELVTNRAGNFFVEGNPSDFKKPFQVKLQMGNIEPQMTTHPQYGGCAHCHDPAAPTAMELGLPYDTDPGDADYQNGTARIGIGGYRPSGPDTPTVEAELRAIAGSE
jgi:hypothetical protein